MRGRVLIADGDADWLGLCERGLGDCGFSVETARSGLACLARLKRIPEPDFVVLDLDLPWGGGDGVLALWPDGSDDLRHERVIVTGHVSSQALSERTGVPLARCLRKPFRLDTLLNAIGRVRLIDVA